jgi:fumarate reductase subunit D
VTARRIPVLLLVVGLFLPFGEPQIVTTVQTILGKA